MELYISCAVKGPAMRKLTVPDSSIFSRSMVKLELFHDSTSVCDIDAPSKSLFLVEGLACLPYRPPHRYPRMGLPTRDVPQVADYWPESH
jgi:hypothetical protein